MDDITDLLLTALEEWVEDVEAPGRIDFAHDTDDYEGDMNRPTCPCPQVAVRDEVGDPNDAGRFSCE